jgi:hypothetical protein
MKLGTTTTNIYQILVGNLMGKRPVGRPLVINGRIILKWLRGCELVQDSILLWKFVVMVT